MRVTALALALLVVMAVTADVKVRTTTVLPTGGPATFTGVGQDPVPAVSSAPSDTRPSFAEWLAGVRTEALARGIREEIVEAALTNIDEPLPVILERDRAQAEAVFSLERYLARRLTPRIVKTGREMLTEHAAILEEVASRYGVPPRIIVAVWGIESNFGRFIGVRPTIAALATLAWDPRRSSFFRGELFDALEIVNRGDIDLSELRGSWAGAMGQVQFMPSSYLKYAEDFDGDGRRDIWSTPADIFASIANYLKSRGWTGGEAWGREVKLSAEARRRIAGEVERRAGGCRATRDMTVGLPADRWKQLGVRAINGRALPPDTPEAALVSGQTRYFLVYRNYDALLEYNCAHSYAISVALLADRIVSPDPPAHAQARKAASKRSKRRS